MIGIIVTGHGHFATGLVNALELLAGATEALEAIDFEGSQSGEELGETILASAAKLDDGNGILVMTDLRGGTPFNISTQLSMSKCKNLEIVAGSNLPMLLEAYMSRDSVDNATALAQQITASGKEQIIYFEKTSDFAAGDDDDEIELD